jgi:hypothetical protein
MSDTSSVQSETRANAIDPADILCTFEIPDWAGPFPADADKQALAALERGKILVFPNLAFAFEDNENGLFSPALSNGKAKNVSLKPSGELGGTVVKGQEARILSKMMERFAVTATRFAAGLLPEYADRLARARTSFRPAEIMGRPTSPLHDDTRLHVDAFPSQPMRGRRILRLFTNVNPYGAPRVWRAGEPFEDMARKLGPRVSEGSPAHSALLAAIGVTKGRRSVYDNLMLGLHNAAKLDRRYQEEAPQAEIQFPPDTTWLCYTDQVMHAAIAGQYALEQTFHLDVDAMVDPALSPLKVLERLRGRSL